MQYIVEPIGELFEWSFGILEYFENLPNYAFIIIGFIGMIYWLILQKRYNKQADQNPDQIK